jgi:hypothetical protein
MNYINLKMKGQKYKGQSKKTFGIEHSAWSSELKVKDVLDLSLRRSEVEKLRSEELDDRHKDRRGLYLLHNRIQNE